MNAAPLPIAEDVAYDPRKHGARCDLCPLKGSTFVPPKPTVGETKVVFVGEAPGRKEELQRTPFVGMTGQFLRATCREVDIDIRSAHLTNSALCRSNLDKENDQASVCCAPRLLKELAALPKDAPIVALGKSAALSILGTRSIMHARGFVWTAREVDAEKAKKEARKAREKNAPKWKDMVLKAQIAEGRAGIAGRTIFPTVHPAFVLRTDTWNPILKLDLERVGRWLRGELRPEHLLDNMPFTLVTTRPNEVRAELKRVCGKRAKIVAATRKTIRRELGKLKPVISVDIETIPSTPGGPDGANPHRNKIVCIGISDGTRTVVLWPWLPTIAKYIIWLFKRCTAIGMHNGYNFDQISMARHGIPFLPFDDKLEDTLVAHHTYASHMPQRLAHVASVYVDVGPWKITFKRGGGEEKGLPPEKLPPAELVRYNAADAVVQAQVWLKQQPDLESERHVYEVDKDNARMCLDGTTPVRMADGTTETIARLVKYRSRAKVLTVERDGSIGARAITGWHRNPVDGRHMMRVTHKWARQNFAGVNRTWMTEDHPVWTSEGYVKARELGGKLMATGNFAPTGTALDIAYGTLLGDATVPRVSSALIFTHAKDQAEYARLKANAFRARVATRPGYNGWQPKVCARTFASAFWRELRAEFYPNGKKRIPTHVIENASDLLIAVWFMDDGYMRFDVSGRKLGKKRHGGVPTPADGVVAASAEICAAGFPRQDVARAVRALRGKGFHCKLSSPGKPNRIVFNASGARDLSRRIARFVPPSMQYKLLPPDRGRFEPRTFDPSIGPFYAEAIVEPIKNYAPATVYCIDVAKTHNFITTAAVVHNCRGMGVVGIGVDLERRDVLRAGIVEKEAILLGEMRKILKRPNFHPMQLAEVRRALFTTLRAPLAAADPTDSGLPSTSSKTLEKLKGSPTRAGRFADTLLQWRGAVKIKGTYIDSLVLDKPPRGSHIARTHFNWRSYGAASGRYSCRLQSCPRCEFLKKWEFGGCVLVSGGREVVGAKVIGRAKGKGRLRIRIEGTGVELEVNAKDVKPCVLETRTREMYCARPGHKLLYFDCSQAELRLAAYLSGDKVYIEMCESGDVHTAIAQILFPDDAELIRTDPKGAGKPFRDVEKNSVFGFQYYADPTTIFQFCQAKGFSMVRMSDVLNMRDLFREKAAGYFAWVERNKKFVDKHGFYRCPISGRVSWLGWHTGYPDIANRPIQKSIASIMNVRVPRILRAAPKGVEIVAQVHDAAIFEVPDKHVDTMAGAEVEKDGKKKRVGGVLTEVWAEPIVIPANGYGSSMRVEDGARSFIMPIDKKLGERWSDFG